MTDKQKGGKREGAGRKPEYGEPTTTVTLRLPVSLVDKVKAYVARLKKQYKNK